MADFAGTDRLGHRVVLTDGTWYGHIVAVHPEMGALRAEVEAACVQAEAIRRSHSGPDCVIHFRRS